MRSIITKRSLIQVLAFATVIVTACAVPVIDQDGQKGTMKINPDCTADIDGKKYRIDTEGLATVMPSPMPVTLNCPQPSPMVTPVVSPIARPIVVVSPIASPVASPAPSPTPDTIAPSEPRIHELLTLSQNSFRVTWTESTDNVGVDHYLIRVNQIQVAYVKAPAKTAVAQTSFALISGQAVTVVAVDAAGNLTSSNPGYLNIFTTQAPAASPSPSPIPSLVASPVAQTCTATVPLPGDTLGTPQIVSLKVLSNDNFTMSWSQASGPVWDYEIVVNAKTVATVGADKLCVAVGETYLQADYSITVYARDRQGNRSQPAPAKAVGPIPAAR